MKDIFIEGGIPLMGNINLSGAKNSAIKLIYASLFSNEDVILENVPNIEAVESDMQLVESLGAKIEWVGTNRLLINASSICEFTVPIEYGCIYRTSLLCAGPLLYRFGKAVLPKLDRSKVPGATPVNRIIEGWKSLGIDIEEDDKFYKLTSSRISPSNVNFSSPTQLGTDSAILSSVFVKGETVINNASEAVEISDLIDFFKYSGVQIERSDPTTIKIEGSNIFKGINFKVQSDISEAVTFATVAGMTKGNIVIKGVEKTSMTSFSSFLSKLGVKFEYDKDELKVWNNLDNFNCTDLTIGPSPAFMTDWHPLAVLMLTRAEGESVVHETIYANRLSYIKDLNRMGAAIKLFKPSEKGIDPTILDDSYDMDISGEPESLIKIKGPSKLKGSKLDIPNFNNGAVLAVAALSAEGKSQVGGWYNVEKGFEDFFDKLNDLGAKIVTE
jgi:UDP-N-acetylglucosamine 1-carboxyvinyltransferase